jgi:hypothetical protein
MMVFSNWKNLIKVTWQHARESKEDEDDKPISVLLCFLLASSSLLSLYTTNHLAASAKSNLPNPISKTILQLWSAFACSC